MKGSTIASYPNRAYICHDCGRNLGNRYLRLRGKKQPDVIIINDKHYCSKCADKHFNNQRLNRVILLTQIANNQPYTHAGYTDTNNTVRSWPDNSIYLR